MQLLDLLQGLSPVRRTMSCPSVRMITSYVNEVAQGHGRSQLGGRSNGAGY